MTVKTNKPEKTRFINDSNRNMPRAGWQNVSTFLRAALCVQFQSADLDVQP